MGKRHLKVWVGSLIHKKEAKNQEIIRYRMLMKMGWSEGKGLGANEDGMTRHIPVAKKFDNLGVGVDPLASSYVFHPVPAPSQCYTHHKHTHHKSHRKAWQIGAGQFSQLLTELNKSYGTKGRQCSLPLPL